MPVNTFRMRQIVERWQDTTRTGHPPPMDEVGLWLLRLIDDVDEARAELREIVDRAHRSLQMSWNPELDEIVDDARSKLMEWEREQS